ncbi:hypothetical protein SKUN_001456 [Spiroplasma kunkelii CR2-3x]|uniref:Spiroplasmavirus-related protein n=1 Tax=Spiroplasma kunkelii CR2-3x TaxID=273035 RepID=A0A0K2JES4_SPIKU|nr:hypothetical protein [Spiroplasma kunkelii]ALA97084.1 hypothetical protein SKUN_00161 [Spiroplasma kunkelii CR2-3x]ALA98198.1 hypothetical protein SKUN_001329 [Spiroplasma kunkelii CR2-3x]ALA98316.1 hypothetical protein SKUN_001456 [Spiroplasma kunkelii CR2-3x]
MKKYKYLLLSKDKFGFNTQFFYTYIEAELTAKNIFYSEKTIINLEKIEWQGE